MKRVGFLMEKMLTEENFIRAEILLARNKKDNPTARRIGRNAEVYGPRLLRKVIDGSFHWHAPREATITDSYKGKTRNLKIPCLEDQAVQIAWLNIATPYIEKRNYFYNCGSIPKAGQTRIVKGLKKWLRNPKMKYGATTDIRKFYDTCPHSLIRDGLRRIFKDKAFVDFAMGFVASMSATDRGIAIGYPSSHWLANVALSELDHDMKRRFPRVKYARYMDDIALTATAKRVLRRAVAAIRDAVIRFGMALKKWGRQHIPRHGLSFLSYRFFNGYTIIVKPLMIRISRRMRKAALTLNRHVAAGIISYFGILKYCDSFRFRRERVYPYVNLRKCIALVK